MTYKQFKKIQVYILITLIYFIFTNNYQLIFKTRNRLTLDQNFLSQIVLSEKLVKNEGTPKNTGQKWLLQPSELVEDLFVGEYIKEKQSESVSRQVVLIDSSTFWLKRLIDELIKLERYFLISVKDRFNTSQKALLHWRNSFLESLEGSPDSRSAPLANGLLFGDVSGISQDDYQSFKVIGILHILSASSANFTIFLHFGLLFWRPFLPFLTKKQLFLLHFALTLLYFSLVGPAPSTTRAFMTLSLCFIASFLLQRASSSLFNLYLAGFLIVLINPIYLRALGFQFSFLASFGILFMYRYLEKEPWVGQNYLYRSLLLTFCAQFFLLPIMIYSFAEVNYIAFLANLIVLPLVEMLTVMFLASFMALFLNKLLALVVWQQLLSTLTSNLLDILFTLIEFIEKIPWKIFTFESNKDLFTAIFILIDIGGIIALNTLKYKKYSKNQYRIFK